jgi:P-type Ca2+ transporter type 2C
LLVRRGAIYTGDVLVEVGGSGYAPDEVHARTMAFTTLTMYQLFHAYNCRSKRGSVFSGFFANKWLLVAIVFSLGATFLVIYVPFLQTAFHTVELSAFDWLVATSVSASLLFAMELAKLLLRRRDQR